MNIADHSEINQHCVFFRPVGKVSLPEAVRLVTESIIFAHDRQIPNLVVNATGLTGFPSPSLAERYFMAREWAAAARGYARVALVIPAGMIDREKFGITVARNSGMKAEVFTSETEAVAWLAGDAAAWTRTQR